MVVCIGHVMTEKQKIARLYKLQRRLHAMSKRIKCQHTPDIRLTKNAYTRLRKFVTLVKEHLRETCNDYETVSRRKLAAALKELEL